MALFLSAFFLPQNASSQDDVIKLIYAETVKDAEGLINTTKATGNVHFEHKDTDLYCDSALFFRDTDIIYAYSNVQINQGDTINLFCDSLRYDGNTNISKLQGNVRMRDSEYKLTTDSLEYNGDQSIGFYENHGVITSIHEDLKLTSIRGYYHANNKAFFFKDSVRVTHPDYLLISDTLEFRTESASAHFHGPTEIILDSSKVECVKGIFYTKEDFIQLWNGAWLLEPKRSFYADSMIFDQGKDIGEGFCQVNLFDSLEQVQFLSDYLWKGPENDTIILKENANIIQYSDKDTMFIMADSIFQYKDSTDEQNMSIAQSNVGIINGEMVVRCDSAYFSEKDSIIKFHKHPIIWNKETQMSADTITAIYYDNEFHKMFLIQNSMIITEQDSIHYDQIKGKMMTATLDSGKIQKVYIENNAQTLYYLVDEKTDSTGETTKELNGMNRIDCNEIYIFFEQSEIDRISFIDEPTATFYPISQIPQKELFLKGFIWEIELKPRAIILE
jgi:lipopolysaccharide export system protein LptA